MSWHRNFKKKKEKRKKKTAMNYPGFQFYSLCFKICWIELLILGDLAIEISGDLS
jgi:hypothetical protein